jgi:hypothetical protein
MIADTFRNRVIARTCITIVAAVAPLSVVFTVYMVFVRPDLLYQWSDLRSVLFVWCVVECLFWGWSAVKYNLRPLQFERVVPSLEERRKLKDDFLQIIEYSQDDVTEFIEGWFKTGRQQARVGEIHKDNIKDWYPSTESVLT